MQLGWEQDTMLLYMPVDAAIRYVETKPANKDDHIVIRKLKHIKILWNAKFVKKWDRKFNLYWGYNYLLGR